MEIQWKSAEPRGHEHSLSQLELRDGLFLAVEAVLHIPVFFPATGEQQLPGHNPEKGGSNQQAGEKAAHMRPECGPHGMGGLGDQSEHKLLRHPRAHRAPCARGKSLDVPPAKIDVQIKLCPGKQHRKGAYDPGNGPRRANTRHCRMEIQQVVQPGSREAAYEVNRGEKPVSKYVFNLVAEHPQEKHVPCQVPESGMKKHGGHDGTQLRMRRSKAIFHEQRLGMAGRPGGNQKRSIHHDQTQHDPRYSADRIVLYKGNNEQRTMAPFLHRATLEMWRDCTLKVPGFCVPVYPSSYLPFMVTLATAIRACLWPVAAASGSRALAGRL